MRCFRRSRLFGRASGLPLPLRDISFQRRDFFLQLFNLGLQHFDPRGCGMLRSGRRARGNRNGSSRHKHS